MKGYQKLAVFLAVLLFSVGLMSVAIDILGDITDLEFEAETSLKGASSVGSEEGEVGQRKGEKVKVEGAPGGGATPLFEITYRPMTRYLRWFIGEEYEGGEWQSREDHEWFQYQGENLELELPDQPPAEYLFTIRPFFNISGFIPGTLYTTRVGGITNLERYPHLALFAAPEPFSTTYGITHTAYEPDESTLRVAEITPNDDYLQVPEEIADRLRGFAMEIVEGSSTPWEQLKAIEAYLKTAFEYDEEYTPAPNETDPVEWFLFEERRGVCGQFNSAFVLLARTLDIPVRTVSGFLIEPESNYQLVLARDAHLWAEASFEGLGWITFDATPERFEEAPMDVQTYPTVTNITFNDPVALKGDKFQVQGTVTLENGSAVDGLTVEIFMKLKKNDTDPAPSGIGIVRDGFFDIVSDASPDMAVDDYNLIAHTLPLGAYLESWSDPPIRIMAETNVTILAPTSAYVGSSVAISGTLIDNSNGQPIPNATLTVNVGNETFSLKSDGEGVVSLLHTYEDEGNETIQIIMEGSDYYLGSNSSFGIAVSLPPTPKPGILQIITMYPYNVMIATGAAVIIGSVILLTRRREQPTLTTSLPELYDEGPLTFSDYKEGVVKLFNRFYARSQRRYKEIKDSMTPREFQVVLLGKMPERGGPALDYLVTAFEIADYSTTIPNQEIYDKCHAAVELLNGLMEHE